MPEQWGDLDTCCRPLRHLPFALGGDDSPGPRLLSVIPAGPGPASLCLLVKGMSRSGTWKPQQSSVAGGGILPAIGLDWTGLFLGAS